MKTSNSPSSGMAKPLPWLVLFIGLVITYMVYVHISKNEQNQDYLRDYSSISQSHYAINQRLKLVMSQLAAVKGFFYGSNDVSPQEWNTFVGTLYTEAGHNESPVLATYFLGVGSAKNCRADFTFGAPLSTNDFICEIIRSAALHDSHEMRIIPENSKGLFWLLTPLLADPHAQIKHTGWLVHKVSAEKIFAPIEDIVNEGAGFGIQMFRLTNNKADKEILFERLARNHFSVNDFSYFNHVGTVNRQKSLGLQATNTASVLNLQDVVGVRKIRHYLKNKKVTYLNKNALVLEAQIDLGQSKWVLKLWRPVSNSVTPKLVAASCLLITLLIAATFWFQLRVRSRAEALADAISLELKHSEARLRAVIDGSNDAIWDHNIQEGTIWYSPRWFAMLGYEDKELPYETSSMKILLHPDESDHILREMRSHLANAKSYDLQFRMRHKSGDYRWIRSRGFVITENNEVVRIVGINSDITEERDYKQTLESAKKAAEDASRAKADFIANMSHEIRTPLNGIVGVVELIQGTELTIKQQQYVNILQSSSLSLFEIVNEILDFSKIEAGQIKIEMLGFNLVQTATEALEIARQYARVKSDLEVMMRIAPHLPGRFISDPTRIRQCLLNLLSNAVKFTHKGHVLLNIDGEEVSEGSFMLSIRVEDTGIGIAPEKVSGIFEQFTQADTSTTREYGGTGLGLAIVKTMVEMLGGTIEVSSKVGEGSCFEMRIPMSIDDQTQAYVNIEDFSTIEGLRMLLVDSNPTSLTILEEMVEHAGLKADLATSAEQALQKFDDAMRRDAPFDFALIDYNLPEMNAEALLELLRTNYPDMRTHCLLTASSLQRGDGERLHQLGYRGYLQKPISKDLLVASVLAVQKLLARGEEHVFVTRHSIAEASRNKPSSTSSKDERTAMRILVVEDNTTNQQVLGWVLEDAGFHYVVANNGKEALDILSKDTHFHCVLMDCQMPVMDGFEATRSIRAMAGDISKISIFALTANASKEDEARAMDAGMNAFLTKPVDPQKLKKLLLTVSPSTETQSAPDTAPDATIIDAAKIQTITGGNKDRMQRFITLFASTYESEKQELIKALQAEDTVAIRHAHTLKGASSNLYALKLQDISKDIEELAKSGNYKGALALLPSLDDAFNAFHAAYQQLLKELA